MSKVVVCLLGPTAAGKTDLALSLCQDYPFEIISVDSAMIYRGMDIGTAKPSHQELAQTPHHLIDIRNPPESYSAAEFCQDAEKKIQEIHQRQKIPFLVGGTMMYVQAFQKGLAQLPSADETIRAELITRAEQKGWDSLFVELQQVDPVSAAKIHAHDKQRLQRALEIYYMTGKTMSSLLAKSELKTDYQFVNLALFPQDRAVLHARIARRFEKMLQLGFIEEVKQLITRWELSDDCPSMRCVGYRQAMSYLNQQETLDVFCDKAIAATRQLAKRQLTWLRHWPNLHYFDGSMAEIQRQVMAILNKIIDNPSINSF